MNCANSDTTLNSTNGASVNSQAISQNSRWACRLGAVGSENALDYTLSKEELLLHEYYDYLPLSGATESPNTHGRLLALDTEMVLTPSGYTLARISLIQLDLQSPLNSLTQLISNGVPNSNDWPTDSVLLDSFIKVTEPVLDYLTLYSGVTKADLDQATLSIDDIRQQLSELIYPNDILCGHGLSNDLAALQRSHPLIIDTALLYPHPDGPPARYSLATLARLFLHQTIQSARHCSIEDARATLRLALLRIGRKQGRLIWSTENDESPLFDAIPPIDSLLPYFGLTQDLVHCVFLRGSRAVGSHGQRGDGSFSDFDFVIVVANQATPLQDIHLSYRNIEAVLYDQTSFDRLINDCTIWALECIFAPPFCRVLEKINYRNHFAEVLRTTPQSIANAKLRRSVSYESGRKWSSAKRYLCEKQDLYSCKKRMFIAMRFLSYGIEIANTGRISDLGCANHLWGQLKDDPSDTWLALRKNHEPTYKELRESFCKVTPKTPRYAGPRIHFGAANEQQNRVTLKPINASQSPNLGGDKSIDSPLQTVRLLLAQSTNGPEQALAALHEFNIAIQQHQSWPNVIQLRYTPYSTPKNHPIVSECRGLILDVNNNWQVLAMPFRRFFNIQESQHNHFDWATAKVYEKIDGSLAILYWYNNQWNVATSRRPDGSSLVGLRGQEGGIVFGELFWAIWQQLGYRLPDPEQNRCYWFELTSYRHPVVVRYSDENLRLVGVRDLATLCEVDPQTVASQIGWAAAKEVPFQLSPDDPVKNTETLIQAAAQLDASMHEGYVVVDANFERIKVKSSDYVRMTWLFPMCVRKNTLAEYRLVDVLIAGERDEFLAYCPEHRDAFIEISNKFEQMVQVIDEAYAECEPIEDQRDFADAANKYPFSDLLFLRKKLNLSSREVLSRMHSKKLVRLLSTLDKRQ